MTESRTLSDIRAPRRRRRWPWLVALVVFLLVLVATLIALDGMARDFARDQIRSRFVSTLEIDPATPVTVDLGPGSIILQGLSGRIDSVDITASTLSIGSLTGSAVVHAEGVPIDSKKSVESLSISFSVPESGVAGLAGNLDGIDLQSVVIEKGEILASGTVSRLGLTLPVGLGFTPSAENGQLQLTPTSVQLDGTSYTTEELRSSPTLGFLVDELLAPRTVCIADRLPASLTLTRVAVVNDSLVLSAGAHDTTLGALGTRGECAGGNVP
ncbi:MAG TPA: DUF2993 domain-containing protein [Pseudolysinimonas sp.]|nr:DUF2993 domain-containing protein [Pseudolysinimonas sp.]